MKKSQPSESEIAVRRTDGLLVLLAAATLVLHLATGGQYGFHRDELATLADARHLAWGYIAYPPVTPFFGRLSLIFFGTSLAGFRFLAALAEAAALILTGWMARGLGGGRGAQIAAAAAALPFCIGAGSLMQYVSFDYLAWVLTSYFVLRLVKSENPRWWIAVGAAIGLGLMAKYSMVFLVAALLGGALLTDARRLLWNRWFLGGVGVALLIFLPNLFWQVQHSFVSIDFLKHIHARDVRIGRARSFLPDQLKITLLAFPIAMAGLGFYFFSREGKRYRILGWMYLLCFAVFLVGKGRGYYLAATYPMLYAAGCVWAERWAAARRRGWAIAFQAVAWIALTADAILVSFLILPLFPITSPTGRAVLRTNYDLREEIGWPELVEAVAHIRDNLPPQDRAHLGILAGNYGEAGAIDLYGPKYGLPRVISPVNSFWLRGYGNPPPEVLIVLGASRERVRRFFSQCDVAGHTPNPYGNENEETTEHSEIFVCRGLRMSWPEFWREIRSYG